MNLVRWRQVRQLCQATLEREPGQRDAFLKNACAGDESLRKDVESLLARLPKAQQFMEPPAIETADRAPAQDPMEAASAGLAGRNVAHYRIQEKIGAGGMGVVYRAEDTHLDRIVAVKVLPAEAVADPERRRRFVQEAKSASALNHPGIVTIHDISKSNGLDFIAMEFVSGKTLDQLIGRKGLPIGEALKYAVQISDALAAAHAAGIVHRDLKPANIMVTETGLVKILDFGLAKLTESAPDNEFGTTKTIAPVTEEGTIIGTAAYMSPEQAEGKKVDARSDIFSFGSVLYEMLAGQRPFQGDSKMSVIAAILHQEPKPIEGLPSELEKIIRRCLRKEPERRFQHMADVKVALVELKEDSESGKLAAPFQDQERLRLGTWLILAASAMIVFAVAAALWFRSTQTPVQPTAPYVQITNFPDSATQPALSPDGRMITFIRGSGTFFTPGQIYVKLLPAGEAVQLTNDDLKKMSPVFSPDGTRIAYTTVSTGGRWDTWTVPVLGGTPQLWLPNASGLIWNGPQRLLFSEIKSAPHMAIVTASESRAEERDIYIPPHTRGMAHRSYPSPDGKWVLIVEMDGMGAWTPCRVVPFDASTSGRQVGPPGAPCTYAAWSPDGKWIYLSAFMDGNYHIWRERFPDGRPEPVTSGPDEEEGIAVAADGRSLITSLGLRQRTVSLHDAQGDRPISMEGYAYRPSLSPDGKKLYYRILKGGGQTPELAKSELWVADLVSRRNELLMPGFDVTGFNVSSDGLRVTFSALDSGGNSRLWLASTGRAVPPSQIPNAAGVMPFFGPPGEILFLAGEGRANFAFRIREDGTQKQKLTEQPVNKILAVSPDGRWFVGAVPGEEVSREMAFPVAGGSPLLISDNEWGIRWSPDMKYFYIQIWAAGMESGSSGRTFILPIPPGKSLPDIPSAGFHSADEITAIPGVRIIESADVSPGPTDGTYAFSVGTVHRNLYRIPLPGN